MVLLPGKLWSFVVTPIGSKSIHGLLAFGILLIITSGRESSGWAQAPVKAEVVERKIISWKPPLYHGWPTLARRADGELLLAFSGGRETHVCPFGRLEWMRSKDSGKTWSWPQVLYDGPIDDRDAGVLETSRAPSWSPPLRPLHMSRFLSVLAMRSQENRRLRRSQTLAGVGSCAWKAR